jgi:hypothetical protein
MLSKQESWQWFGENIGDLVLGTDVMNGHFFIFNTLTEVMVLGVDVLGTSLATTTLEERCHIQYGGSRIYCRP